MSGGNGGEDATHSEKGTQTNGATQAARCALRRDAERAAMRNVVDAGRAGETDALPAGEHFRAIAALAQAGKWRLRGGEETTHRGQGAARRGFWDGLGISAQARDSPQVRECSRACRRNAVFPANGGLLNCGVRFQFLVVSRKRNERK